jgi:hypothetical protein
MRKKTVKLTPIWLRNVVTGIPTKEMAVVTGAVAVIINPSGLQGWTHTCYGGFFLDEEAAKKDSREAALCTLQANREYARRLYKASGLALV